MLWCLMIKPTLYMYAHVALLSLLCQLITIYFLALLGQFASQKRVRFITEIVQDSLLEAIKEQEISSISRLYP